MLSPQIYEGARDFPPSHPIKLRVDCITSTETDLVGWGFSTLIVKNTAGDPEALASLGIRGVMASREILVTGKEGGVR